MNNKIRNAEINDAASITELSNQLGYKTADENIRNRLTILLQNSDHCIYVAIADTKVVGWIHGFYALRVESDFFVEIGGLVVHENYRKKRIGKQLVDRVIQWAALKNCKHVRVRCNVIRKESHKFYEKTGFKMHKEQKIFHKHLN